MRGKKIQINCDKQGRSYAIVVAKNQKVIQIHRAKNGISFAANYEAMKILTPNAYVLFMYLLMHENNRVWALSSKDVYEKTTLTEKTYPKAVQELINKGYLTAGEIDLGSGTKYKEDAYHLWESPDLAPPQRAEGNEFSSPPKSRTYLPPKEQNKY